MKWLSVVLLANAIVMNQCWVIAGAFLENDDRHAICGCITAIPVYFCALWVSIEWRKKP